MEGGVALEPVALKQDIEEGFLDAEGNQAEHRSNHEMKPAWPDRVELDMRPADNNVGRASEDEDVTVARADVGRFKRHLADALTPEESLLKAYDKISKKYKRSKAKKLQEIEALFEDQKRRQIVHAKATNACVDMLRKENLWLKHQIEEYKIEETLVRLKLLERENAECRNDLVMVCAKNLEQAEEIRSLRSIIAQDANAAAEHKGNMVDGSPTDVMELEGDIAGNIHQTDAVAIAQPNVSSSPKQDSHKGEVPGQALMNCCILQVLLQSITKLQLIMDSPLEPSSLTFFHQQTGLKFKLVQTVDENIAECCGDAGELRVEMISLGALQYTAPQWMHDILAFSIKHVNLFFSRINTAIDSVSRS